MTTVGIIEATFDQLLRQIDNVAFNSVESPTIYTSGVDSLWLSPSDSTPFSYRYAIEIPGPSGSSNNGLALISDATSEVSSIQFTNNSIIYSDSVTPNLFIGGHDDGQISLDDVVVVRSSASTVSGTAGIGAFLLEETATGAHLFLNDSTTDFIKFDTTGVSHGTQGTSISLSTGGSEHFRVGSVIGAGVTASVGTGDPRVYMGGSDRYIEYNTTSLTSVIPTTKSYLYDIDSTIVMGISESSIFGVSTVYNDGITRGLALDTNSKLSIDATDVILETDLDLTSKVASGKTYAIEVGTQQYLTAGSLSSGTIGIVGGSTPSVYIGSTANITKDTGTLRFTTPTAETFDYFIGANSLLTFATTEASPLAGRLRFYGNQTDESSLRLGHNGTGYAELFSDGIKASLTHTSGSTPRVEVQGYQFQNNIVNFSTLAWPTASPALTDRISMRSGTVRLSASSGTLEIEHPTRIDLTTGGTGASPELYINGLQYTPGGASLVAPFNITQSVGGGGGTITSYTDTLVTQFENFRLDGTTELQFDSDSTYIAQDANGLLLCEERPTLSTRFAVGTTFTPLRLSTNSASSGGGIHIYQDSATSSGMVFLTDPNNALRSSTASLLLEHPTLVEFDVGAITDVLHVRSSELTPTAGVSLFKSSATRAGFQFLGDTAKRILFTDTVSVYEHSGYHRFDANGTVQLCNITTDELTPTAGVSIFQSSATRAGMLFLSDTDKGIVFTDSLATITHPGHVRFDSDTTTGIVRIDDQSTTLGPNLHLYGNGTTTGIHFLGNAGMSLEASASSLGYTHTTLHEFTVGSTSVLSIDNAETASAGITAFQTSATRSGLLFLNDSSKRIIFTDSLAVYDHPGYSRFDAGGTADIIRIDNQSTTLGSNIHLYGTGTLAGIHFLGDSNKRIVSSSAALVLEHSGFQRFDAGGTTDVFRVDDQATTLGANVHVYGTGTVAGIHFLGDTSKRLVSSSAALVMEHPTLLRFDSTDFTMSCSSAGLDMDTAGLTASFALNNSTFFDFKRFTGTIYGLADTQSYVSLFRFIDTNSDNIDNYYNEFWVKVPDAEFYDNGTTATVKDLHALSAMTRYMSFSGQIIPATSGAPNQVNGVFTGVGQLRDSSSTTFDEPAFFGIGRFKEQWNSGGTSRVALNAGFGAVFTRFDSGVSRTLFYCRGTDGNTYIDGTLFQNQTIIPSFTGVHPVAPVKNIVPGMLVSVDPDGEISNPDGGKIIMLADAIPECIRCSTPYDSAVYGIYLKDDEFEPMRSSYDSGTYKDGKYIEKQLESNIFDTVKTTRSIIAGVGEGAAIVCVDEGEEINPGDILVSSEYGCLQKDTEQRYMQFLASKNITLSSPLDIIKATREYEKVTKYKAVTAWKCRLNVSKTEYPITIPDSKSLVVIGIIM